VDTSRLVSSYPVLYHMAEEGSWESIRELGLLSTSALLDRFEVEDERRRRIESARRPEIEVMEHPDHGRAVIRDNKPMQAKTLERCLTGMTPREWYEALNRRVFFWVDRNRLLKLLGARAYRDRPHLVLELDTAELLRRHAEDITLSAINSGATFAMNPAPAAPTRFAASGITPGAMPLASSPWTTPSPGPPTSPTAWAGGAAGRSWTRSGEGVNAPGV
jgi:hypothetical protein